MNNNDKSLLKQSALITADTIVATFDSQFQTKTQLPFSPFSYCWELSKAVYGSVMQLRQDRALEFVQIVEQNSSVITPEIWEDQRFQDGFVYIFEKYLIERNQDKREYLKNIFLGFTVATDKDKFILEKLIHTLSQISIEDIEVLREVDPEREDHNYQIYDTYREEKAPNIYNLIHSGILLQDDAPHLIGNGNRLPFVKMSSFGKEFIKYLLQ